MNFPDDFPPPKLPPEYLLRYSGDSGTFPDQRYYTLYADHARENRLGLLYDHGVWWPTRNGIGRREDQMLFPSRQEMYNYIETMCVLNTWEKCDE